MYILQEKPDQHATCIPLSARVWSQTIRISRGQRIATFHVVVNRVKQGHCSREKGSRHNLHHVGWPIYRSVPSFSPKIVIEAVGEKLIIWLATRLTGHISPVYDRYVQYLLARVNPSVINRHRWGLQPPKGLARSQIIHSQHKPLIKCDMKHLSLTHDLSTTWHLPKSISMPSNG
jgi:hypothetical protein